jgi:hypothetical protein
MYNYLVSAFASRNGFNTLAARCLFGGIACCKSLFPIPHLRRELMPTSRGIILDLASKSR